MSRSYGKIKSSVLRYVADLMCTAARTAPKTRGKDNLVIISLNGTEIEKVVSRMRKIAERNNRPSFKRDADNLKDAEHIVVIATKKAALGLDCGFCGYASCRELKRTKGVCAYNPMDLGIALGSAVSVAADLRVDNRIMFSIGKAVIELGLSGKDAVQAIGIPLSASGKNPFFDRG
ncbi:MAG: DUF2148 domain-containing protein [Candidatus Omnitrophota bacterium]